MSKKKSKTTTKEIMPGNTSSHRVILHEYYKYYYNKLLEETFSYKFPKKTESFNSKLTGQNSTEEDSIFEFEP